MRKASVRDLHIRTSELVREAAEGAVIVIERRGKPAAELRPMLRKPAREPMPDMTRDFPRYPRTAAVISRKIVSM
jgi:prevent-host-death family protein